MKTANQFFIFLFILCSCKNNQKDISIWIENNSDVNSSMEFDIYLDDSLLDKRSIFKDSIADNFKPFTIKMIHPYKKNKSEIKFISSRHNDSTSCVVDFDSINKSTIIHVNYVERLLRKGYQFNQTTLMRDSVIRKDFYCELINQSR